MELFDSPKASKVYYGSDFIFGLFVNFDWRTWGLYIAGIGIISGGIFKKVDIKDRIYVKIIWKVQFDNVVIKNPFNLVFAYMRIL